MAKDTIQPPIDRPLAKNYLREFTGWTTAYSPGLADSTTLRQLNNVLMNRDGAARIRPALRLMFEAHLDPNLDGRVVGSFEQYIAHDGTKKLIFAVHDGTDITFAAGSYDPNSGLYGAFETLTNTPTLNTSTTYVKYLQINNRIYCLGNSGTDRVAVFNTTLNTFETHTAYPGRPTAPSLTLGGALSAGTYNFAIFITRTNDFGESMPSLLAHINANIKWTGWASGDQINVTGLPATGTWNAYFLTWSDDAPVPVQGFCIKEAGTGTTLTVNAALLLNSSAGSNHMLPSPADEDFSTPPIAAQGLVAGDRLILVNDYENRARIRWSANEPGSYGSFSPAKGGGYKTLSSGNLQIPYGVVLWQNPQSVDTLTILCNGLDGYHASYYMSPASVTAQSEEINIMGFEETSATQGTVAPWGNEVFNNALYRPLDDQLMKSTANNYNINHKSMTDPIANKWLNLLNKRNIISATYDGRLYFIVHDPDGEELEAGCLGNEIWICDVGRGGEGGSPWSRYTIQAQSLRKIAHKGRLYLGVVRPEGIYRLDELEYLDELPAGETPITWYLQTNTQGANGAHDQWVHLQQAGVIVGNFYGTMQYGVSSWTGQGKPLDIRKVYRQPNSIDFSKRPLPFDHEDILLIQRDVREWFFFASSVVADDGSTLPSYGQISNAYYTSTPLSKNVGYEYGSVQTYEYAHAADPWTQRTSINGIPIPVIDPRRP